MNIPTSIRDLGIGILIGLLLGGTAMYFIRDCKTEEVEVPVRIEVPVPIIVKEFDTIYIPKPIRTIQLDTVYLDKWNEIKNDSIRRDSLFREAIKIKEYNERIEDDTIKIDLYAKVRGDLLEYQVGYETKPYTIPLDTTITVPVPRQAEWYVGGELILPNEKSLMEPSVKPEVGFKTRNEKFMFDLGHDFVNKYSTVGIKINL